MTCGSCEEAAKAMAASKKGITTGDYTVYWEIGIAIILLVIMYFVYRAVT